MQWFHDFKAVARLYPNLNISMNAYFVMRFLICPFRKFESLLPKSGYFVDVGCGYGLFANLLAILSPERRVSGCDIDQTKIRIALSATNGRDNISFFVSDVKDLELPECDVVTMVDLLHHVSPELQASLIKDCFAKLKVGGLLVIKDIDTVPFPKYAWNYIHDFIMTRGEPLYFVGRHQMCSLLEKIGFKVNIYCLQSLAPYPHILYLCKKLCD